LKCADFMNRDFEMIKIKKGDIEEMGQVEQDISGEYYFNLYRPDGLLFAQSLLYNERQKAACNLFSTLNQLK